MKIIRVTPSQFARCVVKACGAGDITTPSLYNLTHNKFVVVDPANRARYIQGDKFDLSFLNDLDVDITYLRGSIVEDVTLEDVSDTVFMDDSVLVTNQSDVVTETDDFSLFSALMSLLGLSLVQQSDVTLSRIDNRLHVEFTDCAYFTGAFSVIC